MSGLFREPPDESCLLHMTRSTTLCGPHDVHTFTSSQPRLCHALSVVLLPRCLASFRAAGLTSPAARGCHMSGKCMLGSLFRLQLVRLVTAHSPSPRVPIFGLWIRLMMVVQALTFTLGSADPYLPSNSCFELSSQESRTFCDLSAPCADVGT